MKMKMQMARQATSPAERPWKQWTLPGLNHFHPLPAPYQWVLWGLNSEGNAFIRDTSCEMDIFVEADGSFFIEIPVPGHQVRIPTEVLRALDAACSTRGYQPGLSAGAEVGLGMRAVRALLAVSQTEMAERLGVSGSHLSMVEHGTKVPSMGVFIRFCEHADMPMSDVLRLGESASMKFLTDAAEAERERVSHEMRTSPTADEDAALLQRTRTSEDP